MTKRMGSDGLFWAVDFDIVITLGTVEIKAFIEWEEKVSGLGSGPGFRLLKLRCNIGREKEVSQESHLRTVWC